MVVCKHLRYSGRVQGVGFRMTAKTTADKYPVVGFVRNLPQGDVELVVQGEAEIVKDFLQDLANRIQRNVRQCVENLESVAQYSGFEIRY
ncbi:acylphosphatase [soil metagenome]